MSKGVTTRVFNYSGLQNGFSHSTLHKRFVNMMMEKEEFRFRGRLLCGMKNVFGLSERNDCSLGNIGFKWRSGYVHFHAP